MVILDGVEAKTFIHQTDATLDQAAPAQNTWYTVLNTTINCRIISIAIKVADTGETLEIQLTVDGQVLTVSQAAVANTWYNLLLDANNSSIYLSTADYMRQRAFLLEARSVKFEVRKTTAAGAGTISSRIMYAKRR